jgi:hypothetical protein
MALEDKLPVLPPDMEWLHIAVPVVVEPAADPAEVGRVVGAAAADEYSRMVKAGGLAALRLDPDQPAPADLFDHLG